MYDTSLKSSCQLWQEKQDLQHSTWAMGWPTWSSRPDFHPGHILLCRLDIAFCRLQCHDILLYHGPSEALEGSQFYIRLHSEYLIFRTWNSLPVILISGFCRYGTISGVALTAQSHHRGHSDIKHFECVAKILCIQQRQYPHFLCGEEYSDSFQWVWHAGDMWIHPSMPAFMVCSDNTVWAYFSASIFSY